MRQSSPQKVISSLANKNGVHSADEMASGVPTGRSVRFVLTSASVRLRHTQSPSGLSERLCEPDWTFLEPIHRRFEKIGRDNNRKLMWHKIQLLIKL